MNNNFEIRTASLSASDKKLTGYVIKWNSRSHVLWDEFIEQFAPNAFSASLTANTDVRALYEHDHMNLLGRTTSGTLQLSEDTTGLRFELTPPDTQLGRDVLTLVERGDIQGMSFGFRAIKDQWDVGQEPYVRTVLEAELREITITSLPAYPESGVEIAKRSLNAIKIRNADLRHYWLQLSEV
ncbi:HK97 family phage prohead protease [Xenorhabdus nematophila]|uniref:HK97 family phage prohead protease n=1 Tax=Xenorhabdus nematophila TaxID=628 RepID=UPI0032B84366